MHCHAFLACWLLTLSRSLFNVFYKRLAPDSSNWIKICLNSSARILESFSSTLLILFNSFVGDFEQVYVQCVKSALRLFCSFGMFEFLLRSTLFCLSFEYCWSSYLGVHSDCALSIWVSPSKFKQLQPIYHFLKPEKLSQTQEIRIKFTKFVWKLISKPGCIFVGSFCANKNKKKRKQYIHI